MSRTCVAAFPVVSDYTKAVGMSSQGRMGQSNAYEVCGLLIRESRPMTSRDLIWKREYLVPDDDDDPEQTEDIDETAN